MRESSACRIILDEGRAEGIQRVLLHQGRKKFGGGEQRVRS
jgi:hypothetical protein